MGQNFFLQIFLHIFSRGSFEITRIMQKSIVLHSKCHFIGSLFSSDFSSFFLVFCKKFREFFTNSRLRLEFAKSYTQFFTENSKKALENTGK